MPLWHDKLRALSQSTVAKALDSKGVSAHHVCSSLHAIGPSTQDIVYGWHHVVTNRSHSASHHVVVVVFCCVEHDQPGQLQLDHNLGKLFYKIFHGGATDADSRTMGALLGAMLSPRGSTCSTCVNEVGQKLSEDKEMNRQ